ncbi:hypothetical protein I4U23_015841 [Adineta vaga]|nr:hypothetical protein I4U23_015841 [Adineta vaga]
MFFLNSCLTIRKLSSRIYIPLSSFINPAILFNYSSNCDECLCHAINSTTETANFVAMNCLTNIHLCQFYTIYATNYSIEWNSTSDFYFFEVLPSMMTNMNERSTDVTILSTTAATTTAVDPNFYTCGNMTVLIGYDFYGNDLDLGIVANHIDCCLWCRSNSSCVAYTWVVPTNGGTSSTCYLKIYRGTVCGWGDSSTPPSILCQGFDPLNGCPSGYLQQRFKDGITYCYKNSTTMEKQGSPLGTLCGGLARTLCGGFSPNKECPPGYTQVDRWTCYKSDPTVEDASGTVCGVISDYVGQTCNGLPLRTCPFEYYPIDFEKEWDWHACFKK